jgi:hypothetical protein
MKRDRHRNIIHHRDIIKSSLFNAGNAIVGSKDLRHQAVRYANTRPQMLRPYGNDFIVNQ